MNKASKPVVLFLNKPMKSSWKRRLHAVQRWEKTLPVLFSIQPRSIVLLHQYSFLRPNWKIAGQVLRTSQDFPEGVRLWLTFFPGPSAKSPWGDSSFGDCPTSSFFPTRYLCVLQQEGRNGVNRSCPWLYDWVAAEHRWGQQPKKVKSPLPHFPCTCIGPVFPYHIGKNSCKHILATSHRQCACE